MLGSDELQRKFSKSIPVDADVRCKCIVCYAVRYLPCVVVIPRPGRVGRVAHGIYSHLGARQIRLKEGVYRVIPNPMTPTP